ncbi:MAG: hypothetical protein JZU55_18720 [Afipia sp.]|jgi:hypothetical protein|nr:hypothetical protein [Afipia sp.]MCR6736746.1 hypothetical protein [Afipia sp.]
MTAVNITFADPGSNLLAYLEDWIAPTPITNHGEFNTADNQWAGGDELGGSTNAVVLDGEDFTYPIFGGFSGTVETLTFGDGLSGTAAGTFSVDDVQLTLDLGDVAANNTFNFAIYGLQTGDISYLEAYFDEVGTEQHSTAGDDALYGFAATDTFSFSSTTIGQDVIDGFNAGTSSTSVDVIEFSTSVFANWGAVYAAASQEGSDVVIEYSPGNSITLQQTNLANLNASDFAFV